eukprot:EG_transcript_682
MPLRPVAAAAAQGVEVAQRAKSSAQQAERRAEADARASAGHYLGVAQTLATADSGRRLPLALDVVLCAYLRCLRVPPRLNPASDLLLGHGVHMACMDDFRGSSSTVVAARLSPDGRLLASLHANHVLFVWDVPSRQQLLRLGTRPSCQALTASGGSVGCAAQVAFSPDSRWLVHEYWTAEQSSTLMVWEFGDDAERPFLPVVMPQSFLGTSDDEDILALAFNPQSRSSLAVCTYKAAGLTLRLTDIEAKRLATMCPVPSLLAENVEECVLLAWSADGTRLAASVGGNEVLIWTVVDGQPELLQKGLLVRTGKLLGPDYAAEVGPKRYPPPIRQWEEVQPLGLCFGPDYQLGVAFQHRYAFQVDVSQLEGVVDPRLVPDEEMVEEEGLGRFERRDVHLFRLAAPEADGEYRVVGRGTWGFAPVENSASHSLPMPQTMDMAGAVFFHPETGALSAALPVQTGDTKPYVVYLTQVPSHQSAAVASSQTVPAAFQLPLATYVGLPCSNGTFPVGMMNGTMLLVDSLAAVQRGAVRLSVLPSPRTVYDSRDWDRNTFRLDRRYFDDLEAEAKAAKEQALAAQRQHRADGEDEEAPEEAAVDEDEEVPEKLRRAQEKERQLRELQQAEFGVGWRLRLNARPMAVSGAPAAVLGLFLAQEGPLLLAASADASVRVYDVPGARLVRQTEGEGGCAAFQEVAFADEGEVAAFRGTRTVDRPLAAPKESGEADGEEEVEEDMEPDAASPDEEEEKGGVEEAPEEDEEEGGEEERNEGPPVEAPDAERDEEPESGEKVDEAQVVDQDANPVSPAPPEPTEVVQDILCVVDVGRATRELIHLSDHPASGLAVLPLPDAWLAFAVCRPHQPSAGADLSPAQPEDEPAAEAAAEVDPEAAAAEEEEVKEETLEIPAVAEDNEDEEDNDDDSDSESDLGASEREERARAAEQARAKLEEVARRRLAREQRQRERQEELLRLQAERQAQEQRTREESARYAAAKEGTMDVEVVLLRVKDVSARVSQRQEEVEEEIEAEEGEEGEAAPKPAAPLDTLAVYPLRRAIPLNYWKHFAGRGDWRDPEEYKHLRFSFAATGLPPQVFTALAHRNTVFVFNEEGEAVLGIYLDDPSSVVQDLTFSLDGTLLAVTLAEVALVFRVSDGATLSAWAVRPGGRARFGPGGQLMLVDDAEVRIVADGRTLQHRFAIPQSRPTASHLCQLTSGALLSPAPGLYCSVLAGPRNSPGIPVVLQAARQGTSTAETLRSALLGQPPPTGSGTTTGLPLLDSVPGCAVQRFQPSPGPIVISLPSA